MTYKMLKVESAVVICHGREHTLDARMIRIPGRDVYVLVDVLLRNAHDQPEDVMAAVAKETEGCPWARKHLLEEALSPTNGVFWDESPYIGIQRLSRAIELGSRTIAGMSGNAVVEGHVGDHFASLFGERLLCPHCYGRFSIECHWHDEVHDEGVEYRSESLDRAELTAFVVGYTRHNVCSYCAEHGAVDRLRQQEWARWCARHHTSDLIGETA